LNSHEWPGWSVEVVIALPAGSDPAHRPAPREFTRPEVADSLTEHIEFTDPREALLSHAVDSDLVVVGTRGRGLLKALRLGSTAEWIIQEPAAPTMIVRGGHTTRRILLAHDGSADAQAAEDAILRFPWAKNVEVLVVSVAAESTGTKPVIEAAVERLQGRVAHVEARSLSRNDLEIFARPRDVLLKILEEWEADLIALGSREISAWDSLNEMGLRRAGSTASVVARHAKCSVLIAKAHPVPE
jgi:nucleotide-binding universal stress UspA family protein